MASLVSEDATAPAFDPEDAEEMVLCARYGEMEEMVALLDAGIPVDYKNSSDNTALHMVAANGNEECAKALIERGARDQPNGGGNYALHWAVQNQHLPVVKVLLTSSHANVLAQNGFGKSAVTEAFGRENVDITAALLSHPSAKELEKSTVKGGKVSMEDDDDSKPDGNEEPVPSTPLESRVVQEKVHAFNFGNPNEQSLLVKCRELALNWEGKAFHDNVAEHDVTGVSIWSASIVISRWVLAHSDWFHGKDVVELGAGCGLPGVTIGATAAPKSVLLTDVLPHCIENLEYNLRLNGITDGAAATLDWNKIETWPKSEGAVKRFDVVIGSDLVYDLELVPSLVSVVSGLLQDNGVFLYVAPSEERDGLNEWLEAMVNGGFKYEQLPAPEEYYENPLLDATETECDLHFNELSSKKYSLYKFEKSCGMP